MRIKVSLDSIFPVLEDLPAPMYVTDVGGQVRLWNRALIALTGVDQAIGRIPGPLLAVSDNFIPIAGDNPLLAEVLSTQQSVARRDCMLSIRTQTGDRAIDFNGEPILDESSGTLLGAIGVLTERTPQRTLERALDGVERTAGHDLRNAVGVLEGYLPLLLSGEATRMEDGGQSIFQTLLRTSKLLTSIVNLMLLNARCCRSLLCKESHPIPLNELLAASRRAVEPMAINKDIVLAAVVDESLQVQGHEELLYAAFANLFFAASKLARNRSMVQVTAEPDNGQTEIRMTFAARAIDPVDLRRLFSALGEVQDPRLAVGISVHLAHVILKLHGATLQLLEAEAGTNVFAFALPVRMA